MTDPALIRKLRWPEDRDHLVLDGPPEVMGRLGKADSEPSGGTYAFVLLFVHTKAALAERLPYVLPALTEDSIFWIAYPKKSSAIASDINRDSGWEPVHEAGYGPVSQVAVDETYSALRFRPEKNINRKHDSVFRTR